MNPVNMLLILAPLVVGAGAAVGTWFGLPGAMRAPGAPGLRAVRRWIRLMVATVVGLAAGAGFTAAVGAMMPRTHTATRSAHYGVAPEAVWALISDFPGHLSWRPGLRATRRLEDRDGHPVWNQVGAWGPGAPREFEILELEISAFLVWLSAPSSMSLLDAEAAIKDLDIEIEQSDPPRLMRTRIVRGDDLIAGAWTWEITPAEGGCRLRISEESAIGPAAYRYLARASGHAATIELYLRAIGRRLGQPVRIDP
jgi:hypothetical protein